MITIRSVTFVKTGERGGREGGRDTKIIKIIHTNTHVHTYSTI